MNIPSVVDLMNGSIYCGLLYLVQIIFYWFTILQCIYMYKWFKNNCGTLWNTVEFEDTSMLSMLPGLLSYTTICS